MADALSEYRKQFPAYDDMTDAELSFALIKSDPQQWRPLLRDYVNISLGQPQTMFGNIQVPQTPGLGDPTATKTTPGALALEGLRTVADIGLPAAGGIAGAAVPGGGLMTAGAGAALGGYGAKALRGEFMPDLPSLGLDAALGALGVLPAKLGGMAVARPDVAGGEALSAAQSFRRRIHLTASEQSGKAGMAQFERFPERFPSSATRYGRYAERRHEEVGAAMREIAGEAGATTTIDEAGAIVKRTVRGIRQQETQAAERESADLILGFGRPAEREGLGKTWKDAYWRLNNERRAMASVKYDAAEQAVQGQSRPATQLRNRAEAVFETERILRGISPSQPRAAAQGAMRATQPPEQQVLEQFEGLLGKQGIGMADLPPDTARQFVEKYGLNQAQSLSFQQMRAIQSELGRLMDLTKGDKARRGLRDLFEAVSADIDTFQNPLIAEANRFYKKDVAALFGPHSNLRKLSDVSETDRIADKLLKLDSPSQVRALMVPLSVDEAGVYRSTFLKQIHDAGVNIQTLEWDPAKYLRATAHYSDDTIKTLLGSGGFTKYAAVRDRARAAVAKIEGDLTSSRILGAQDEKVLSVLVRDNATKDVARMMAGFDEPTKAVARAGKWQELIFNAENKQEGGFSLVRFRNQLASIDPATRQAFFGDRMAARIGQLQKVLQRIGHTGAMSANPSETAKGIGGMAQIQGIFRLGGGLAAGGLGLGAATGTIDPSTVAIGALVLLSPNLIGRLVTSERGIALLTQGLIAKPGTQAATRVLGELAAFGVKAAGQ